MMRGIGFTVGQRRSSLISLSATYSILVILHLISETCPLSELAKLYASPFGGMSWKSRLLVAISARRRRIFRIRRRQHQNGASNCF